MDFDFPFNSGNIVEKDPMLLLFYFLFIYLFLTIIEKMDFSQYIIIEP